MCGLLLRKILNISCVDESCRFNGVLFAFSTPDALHAVIDSPQTILDGVRLAVHNAPLLGHTLGLTTAAATAGGGSSSNIGQLFGDDQIFTVLPVRHIMQMFEAAVKVDAETQTPTHFVEKNIDVNYEWNEWALRRRVRPRLGLADPCGCWSQALQRVTSYRMDPALLRSIWVVVYVTSA